MVTHWEPCLWYDWKLFHPSLDFASCHARVKLVEIGVMINQKPSLLQRPHFYCMCYSGEKKRLS